MSTTDIGAVTAQLIPFRTWETWVRITEPEVSRDGALPVIVLHGGPGMAHDYVQNLAALSLGGRRVIHYDQLGCGRSTHVPEAPADFWAVSLFIAEFENVVERLGLSAYHLVGQSWGGMLAAEIAVRRPAGLRSLTICNSPASMELWVQGAIALRAELPGPVRHALERHEREGSTEHPEYLAAAQVFYDRHVCRVLPTPPDFAASVAQMEAEPTVYHTMNGPNEFHVIGTLREWSVIERLPAISAPTFVIAGEHDEAVPASWQPFVDHIPDARSHVIAGASHCAHLEDPDGFMALVGGFLAEHDAVADAAPHQQL